MGTLIIKLNPDHFSDDFVDNFVAHRISQLTLCGAPALSDRTRTWLSRFILNSCFDFHLTDKARAFVFNYISRVEATSAIYLEARNALIQYLDHLANRVTGASHYFHSLILFETCVSQMYQAAELLYLPLGINMLDAGDDVQRLGRLYVAAKHMDQMIQGRGKFPKAAPCGFWITNTGLGSSLGSMTFTELCGIMEELANYADQLAEMESLRKKKKESRYGVNENAS